MTGNKQKNKQDLRQMRKTARRVFLDPSTPPASSIIRVVCIFLLVILLAILTIWLLYQLSFLLFLVVLSIFFAYLLDPLVRLIRRPFKQRKLENWMPRSLAIFVSYLLVFSFIILVIAYLTPVISTQIQEFTENLPNYTIAVQERLSTISDRFDQMMISAETQKQINEKIAETVQYIVSGIFLTGIVGSFALNLVTILPWLLLIPILGFFFLKDVYLYRMLFLRIFPSGRWRDRAELALEDVNKTLAAYVRAQLISCILIGTICTIGFTLIGLDYALLLGVLAGIFEFVPLLGPITIGIIAVLVGAFSENPWHALWTAIFLLVLRITHDYVTYPRIVRDGIHLHPLAIILSVLAGEQIAGIPGVFLSIPIVATLTVLYKHALKHSGKSGFISAMFNSMEEDETKVEVIKTQENESPEETEI